MSFLNGQSVEWTSQANGKSKTKTGTIVAVVPAGQSAKVIAEALSLIQNHIVETDWDAPATRPKESYLVSVQPQSRRPAKPHLYWPRTSLLHLAGSQNASVAASTASLNVSDTVVSSPSVTAPVSPDASPILRNHIGFLMDTSISMRDKISAAQAALNQNMTAIKKEASSSRQITSLSLASFDDPDAFTKYLVCVDSQKDLNIPSFRAQGGSTALFDATAGMIDLLESLPEAKDENTSFILSVFTDGEENSSQRWERVRLAQRIKKLMETGRWTLTFMVPPGPYKGHLVSSLGIPAGNVQTWEQSARGMQQAGEVHAQAVKQFYADRSAGKKSTQKFYVDLSKVSTKDIEKNLVDVSAHFKSWVVPKSGLEISQFIEEKTKRPYIPGSAYYPLLKPEYLLKGRAILLIKFGEDKIYGGPAVRQLLGIPENEEKVRLDKKNLGDYTVLLQSASTNRHLVSGTRVYLDQAFTGGMAQTNPVLTATTP